MNDLLSKILELQGIDPDSTVDTDNGERTAFQVLESAVMGALDQIEDGQCPLLEPLVKLIEICRVKCSPFDEIILSTGESNHDALVEAITAVEALGEHPFLPLIPHKSGANQCSIHTARLARENEHQRRAYSLEQSILSGQNPEGGL